MIIPGQGHLYFQIYLNGVAVSREQAGPVLTVPPRLVAEKFSQNNYADPAVDITAYLSPSNLISLYNKYLSVQKAGNEPTYDPLGMNSNTWAAALMLANAIPSSAVDGFVSNLSSKSGLTATGYSNGILAVNCFSNFTAPFPQLAPQDQNPPSYGGCTSINSY